MKIEDDSSTLNTASFSSRSRFAESERDVEVTRVSLQQDPSGIPEAASSFRIWKQASNVRLISLFPGKLPENPDIERVKNERSVVNSTWPLNIVALESRQVRDFLRNAVPRFWKYLVLEQPHFSRRFLNPHYNQTRNVSDLLIFSL